MHSSSAVPGVSNPAWLAIKQVFKDYLELSKARLVSLVLITTALGFFWASGAFFRIELLYVLLGTTLMAGGSSAANQLMEIDNDRLMKRTIGRPLVTGSRSKSEAFVFSVLANLIGFLVLYFGNNLLTAALGAVSSLVYVFFYTPLKTRSVWNTFVGAIPGALPPLMGWAATGTALSVEAFVLFGILFFWQIPHFYAIALLFEEDYRKAGFKMLPSEDRVGSQTAWQMLICTILLVGVSVFPFYWGGVSEIYFFGAALMGGAFLALTAQMFVHLKELGCLKMPRRNLARRVFLGSIAYFPILMVFLFLDRIWTVAL